MSVHTTQMHEPTYMPRHERPEGKGFTQLVRESPVPKVLWVHCRGSKAARYRASEQGLGLPCFFLLVCRDLYE